MRLKRLRIRCPKLALRTELILLVGAIVLLATASLASIAFQTSRAIVEQSTVRALGVVANGRKRHRNVPLCNISAPPNPA